MIAASLRFAVLCPAALRYAAHRHATRLWAAWNRLCGSGMPKGINPAPRIRATLRVTTLRIATQRNATLRAATQR